MFCLSAPPFIIIWEQELNVTMSDSNKVTGISGTKNSKQPFQPGQSHSLTRGRLITKLLKLFHTLTLSHSSCPTSNALSN